MNRTDRIKQLIDHRFDGKQSDFAKAIGKQAQQVNHWLNGYRNVGNGIAAEIEDKLNLPRGWLDSKSSLPELAQENDTTVFELLDIAASCGTGEDVYYEYPEILRTVEINNNFIKSLFGHRDISGIKIINTAGDSMEPTIPKNSATFIDTNRRTFHGDGIYLFFYCGELYLKRLQKTPQNLLAISDNPKYKEFAIDKNNLHEFNIIGEYAGRIDFQID